MWRLKLRACGLVCKSQVRYVVISQLRAHTYGELVTTVDPPGLPESELVPSSRAIAPRIEVLDHPGSMMYWLPAEHYFALLCYPLENIQNFCFRKKIRGSDGTATYARSGRAILPYKSHLRKFWKTSQQYSGHRLHLEYQQHMLKRGVSNRHCR